MITFVRERERSVGRSDRRILLRFLCLTRSGEGGFPRGTFRTDFWQLYILWEKFAFFRNLFRNVICLNVGEQEGF